MTVIIFFKCPSKKAQKKIVFVFFKDILPGAYLGFTQNVHIVGHIRASKIYLWRHTVGTIWEGDESKLCHLFNRLHYSRKKKKKDCRIALGSRKLASKKLSVFWIRLLSDFLNLYVFILKQLFTELLKLISFFHIWELK